MKQIINRDAIVANVARDGQTGIVGVGKDPQTRCADGDPGWLVPRNLGLWDNLVGIPGWHERVRCDEIGAR